MKNSIFGKLVLKTNAQLLNTSLLLLRAIIGIILFMVGSGKVLGWFGGMGLQPTIQSYAEGGFSVPLAYLSSFTEFIGGFLLIVGLFTRPAAFAVMINMIVATSVMMPKGFIAGGAAYPFTLAVIAVIILLAGPLAFSLDYLFLHPGEIIKGLSERNKEIITT